MRRRMMILAEILAVTVFAAMPLQAAQAESDGEGSGIVDAILGEEGIAGQLFGEGGLLEGELPEGTDIDGMLDTLKEQLGEADSEIARVAGSILDKAKEDGSYDLDWVKEILTPVLGQFLGDGSDLGGIDIEKLFAQGDMARDLAKDYILEKNADILESGDVQIVDVGNVYEEMGLSEEFPYLTYVLQYNYTEDEEHQLHYLCGSGDLLLMTLHEEEDGSFTVLDAQVPEEEDYEEFLQDFCGNLDKTPEDLKESIEFTKGYFPYTLAMYLEEHPEYTGLEYEGEMHTAEELEDIAAERLSAMYPSETESEDQ